MQNMQIYVENVNMQFCSPCSWCFLFHSSKPYNN